MTKFIDKYLSMIVIIAILAVILSRRSSTTQVLQSLASAMSNILGSIVAPISSGTAKAAATETPTGDKAGGTVTIPPVPGFSISDLLKSSSLITGGAPLPKP